MTKAFANVLLKMHHKYCIWHIVSKFSEKISALSYKEHYDELKKCIWNSESPKEFEAKWIDVVHKANLSTNEWLKAMYEIRERWISAYMKCMVLSHIRHNELDLDHKDLNEKP
ncbi:protein FAR1-RELATED SEQUENCE 7-like [Rhododendron vialii]|uniref:protein FAR1-RELATED SEQUENCE 7-like n=1 Tax=Rhododendron vialii TaxID=182163 RepID=UPI00265DFD14|nr:protein FAR1-RELATED SEQUENCE 7-like [Rhododendron vialii]